MAAGSRRNFYYGVDLPLYLLLVPVVLVALGVLATQRSWYGWALVLGVSAIMTLPFYLRASAGFWSRCSDANVPTAGAKKRRGR
jgi:hypothetical protein